MMKKILAGAAAAGLLVTPLAAQADVTRASAPVADANGMTGEASGWPIIVFALVAIGVGIFAATGDDDEPISA